MRSVHHSNVMSKCPATLRKLLFYSLITKTSRVAHTILLVECESLSRAGRMCWLAGQGSDGGAGCSEAAEAAEEIVGGGDVAGNLLAEFFRAGEFLFLAKTLPELHLNTRGRGFAHRLKDMRLDAQG